MTVNTDLNSNYTSFFETKTKELDKPFLINKRDQLSKLYTDTNFNNDIETNITLSKGTENQVGLTTDSNSFDSNNNRSSLSKSYNDKENKNSFNKQTQKSLDRQLINIEVQMEKALLDNKTNSKSKKYNTIKHSFEEVIKIFPPISNTKLFQKMLVGYHEVVTSFSNENRELKETNNDLNISK